ncbi:Signal transduction histidine kinase [Paenibacillus catalpae]|uniref:histidine kinase n=1 Tax=Paenibacillus catalpae TaxID=1045775 RepID=A0A1I2GQC3_9BACL|nr:sensor histidine kinase [Paenibacillus catalpae]SFF19815.1 Signal transduction histidine kinase [Paenibacillus catalpae]
MSFWRFLKYERPYFLLYGVAFLLTAAIFATDPQSSWHWPTFFYALVLVLLWLAAFAAYRYTRNLQAVRQMRSENAEPLSLEAEAYRDTLEESGIAHIRSLNEVHARQKEYYDFIISWFHEIKTPISVLRLMQQTEVDPQSLNEELSRIEHFVDQALYYAKLDSFNQDYEIVNCDLEPLVKDVIKAHSKVFISKRIRVQLELPYTVVQSDSKWLLFIINQIITNSLQYTGEYGVITVQAAAVSEEKVLILRDNGIGIDAKDLPRIFNRGFTGMNGRTHAKSTGMGLYLAQELSKKLGHYITCESAPGEGTTFTIHFPKHHDPYLDTLQRRE